ncbi:carbohydrate-binding domain-containing protein [Paenibacillus sp. FSL R7-0345]|uniref:carbohydrate-binding domain-containing protein n=1 Tax=Paenibacillus sp. FSL R7-0345 TaxID=2954535 RepID=UPI00315B3589
MKKIHASLAVSLILAVIASGCGSASTAKVNTAAAATYADVIPDASVTTAAPASTSVPDIPQEAENMDTDIILGDSVRIEGGGAEAHGQQVTISSPGIYRLSGILANGSMDINAPGGSVELVLEGVSIRNPAGPAIQITAAAKAVVTLEPLTVNTLSGAQQAGGDAALLSQAPLTITGEGYLNVEGLYQTGIAAAQILAVEDGILHVNSAGAGLQAASALTPSGGTSAGSINISGGYLYVESAGASMEADGDINISGGTVIALGSLDEAAGDKNHALNISGGTVIAAGATVPEAASGSAQSSAMISFDALQKAGTLAVIQSGAGNLLIFAPAAAYGQLLYSAPALQEDTELTVRTGGIATGEADDGLYSSNAYTSGTYAASSASVTINAGS